MGLEPAFVLPRFQATANYRRRHTEATGGLADSDEFLGGALRRFCCQRSRDIKASACGGLTERTATLLEILFRVSSIIDVKVIHVHQPSR